MLKIYCDGACSGNPGPGAWAYVACFNDKIIYSNSGYNMYTTNNQMELLAAINALEFFDNCEFILDSKYVLDGINIWIHSWKLKGWKTTSGAVKNYELWKKLDILNNHRKIKWTWQKGHNSSFHDYVDLLARSCLDFNL